MFNIGEMNMPRRPLKIGLTLPTMENWMDGITPRWSHLRAMAQHAEAAGFDSIWVNDHLLYRPGAAGEPSHGGLECFSLFAAVAAITSRVEIGTHVVCTAWRNPALIAKMADTIDEISNGRIILGLGAGWHEPEFRAFGFSFENVASRFEEALQIIHPLLRTGTVNFEGKHYQARDCELLPRGPRPSGPPILIGARVNRPRALRLTAQYADYWNVFSINQPDKLPPFRKALDEACAKVGRDPKTLQRTVTVLIDLPGYEQSQPNWARKLRTDSGPPVTGTADQLAELIQRYAREGIDHLLVWPEPNTMAGIDVMARVLEIADKA
jgi:probable F420-dependent oxidoreductase